MIELCNMAHIREVSAQKNWIHMNFDSEFRANMISVKLIIHQIMEEYLQYFQYKQNDWYAVAEKWMAFKWQGRFQESFTHYTQQDSHPCY